MGSKGKGASPPDPQATAAAQAAANKETAIAQAKLNMINQVGPYGTVTYSPNSGAFDADRYMRDYGKEITDYWTTNGRTPLQHYNQFGEKEGRTAYQVGSDKLFDPLSYTQTTTLSPDQQKMLDLDSASGIKMSEIAKAQLGRLEGSLAEPVDFSGLPPAAGAGDFSADRARVEEALLSRMQPEWDRDYAAMETNLVNKGFQRGSEAYNREMDEMRRAQTDARMQAILAGGQEQSRLVGLTNDARGRAMQELLTKRNQPLNEISALMSGSQIQMPGGMPVPQTQIQPTDITGPTYAAYNAKLAGKGQQQAAMGSTIGALGTAASAAAMFF